jgi:hypothetical protein
MLSPFINVDPENNGDFEHSEDEDEDASSNRDEAVYLTSDDDAPRHKGKMKAKKSKAEKPTKRSTKSKAGNAEGSSRGVKEKKSKAVIDDESADDKTERKDDVEVSGL